MNESEPIFELLKSIRMAAIKDQNRGLLEAVEHAEKAAREEIFGVSLSRKPSKIDIAPVIVFPPFAEVFH